jgi:2-polyprenyl-3-methyl-5-hydroxy-6-metoxy-1,4-benzoquinol methylase
MLRFVPDGVRRILDVGCGAGVFGAGLRRRPNRPEVWGVEPHEDAAAEAARRLDRVVLGRYPEVIDELEGPFDCVVFNDVLEHLVDPWDALRRTQGVAGPDGCVVASIPNLRNWRSILDLVRHGDFPYASSGVHDVTHLRWFTRRSAVAAFEEAGWRVDRAEMTNPFRFPKARVLGPLLAPFAPGLRAEADFKQIVIVASRRRAR